MAPILGLLVLGCGRGRLCGLDRGAGEEPAATSEAYGYLGWNSLLLGAADSHSGLVGAESGAGLGLPHRVHLGCHDGLSVWAPTSQCYWCSTGSLVTPIALQLYCLRDGC